MELYTQVELPDIPFLFSHKEEVMMFGSCFVENIGFQLKELKINTDINPFGTLYNPASISGAIRRLLQPVAYTEADLFQQGGVFNSFDHHSRFSATTAEESLGLINTRLQASARHIKKAERMIVTFGSSYVYKLKETGRIVANCHKQPEKIFNRELLPVRTMADDWHELLAQLWKVNNNIRIVFTVSPIRHWKDGAHGNQLSKAGLLLLADELQRTYPDKVAYFPAYEIMMDELRDYRFYAEDMIHPSPLAINYIRDKFIHHCFTKESQTLMSEWNKLKKAIEHKPFQPGSDSYKQFISQTLLKMNRFSYKFPYFDITNEKEELIRKL